MNNEVRSAASVKPLRLAVLVWRWWLLESEMNGRFFFWYSKEGFWRREVMR